MEKQLSTLLETLRKHDPDADASRVTQAFEFAKKHHGDQQRASGEPYYQHPVEVARILAEIGMDETTIITAILHDTVEDTDVTLEDIEQEFGGEVRTLVDGVTKLTQIEFQSENSKQAENFRKLFIAISEDIRVVLVKLADRLHNMRTLYHIKKPEKRKRIAQETMEIFAPLAERMGMQQIKTELQDIAFSELHPEGYQSIYNRLEYLRNTDKINIQEIVDNLTKILVDAGIKAEILGREKMPYSIWRKMERKNISFEQLTDIIAFRVIVNTVDECYLTLGTIHTNFHTVPGSFKDFISLPKENGYRSLHTIIMGPKHQRIEIQIRTRTMHEIAEFGVAAHWTYKQNHPKSVESKQYQWVKDLVSIISSSTTSPEEFLENTKMELYHDQVFCFTPKGRLIVLPKGSTPVDFAYAVHSNIGSTCVGAKINGRIVPLRTQLRNGDQVEVICSKSQQPSPTWEHFVVTAKAKAEVRKFVRSQKRKEYIALGKSIIEKTCEGQNIKCTDDLLKEIAASLNKKDSEELFASVGQGIVSQKEILRTIAPEKDRTQKKRMSLLQKFMSKRGEAPAEKEAEKQNVSVPIRGLIPGMAMHFAPCCNPLPGESIIGIMTSGKGVMIHTKDCRELSHFNEEPERWLDVDWESSGTHDGHFVARVKATLAHRAGSLGILANVIAQGDGNINNLRITDRHKDYFEMVVDIEVADAEHLAAILASLRSKECILSVERSQGGQVI